MSALIGIVFCFLLRGRAQDEQKSRLFQCGYPSMTSYICNMVLPDLPQVTLSVAATSSDILVVGMHGPFPVCPRSFPGKVVLINGEAYGGHPSGTFMLGTEPDGVNSVLAYHGAMMANKKYGIFAPTSERLRSTCRCKFLLYLSSRCFEFRDAAFDALSEIGNVEAAGRCNGLNSSPRKSRVQMQPYHLADNTEIYRGYRFALAMENTKKSGYITEKIINAFAGGAIPIYFGTEEIFEVFNKDAFIFYDITNPSAALDQIRYLENNMSAYDEMQRLPIFANGSVERFFSFEDNVGGGLIKQKIRRMLGISEKM